MGLDNGYNFAQMEAAFDNPIAAVTPAAPATTDPPPAAPAATPAEGTLPPAADTVPATPPAAPVETPPVVPATPAPPVTPDNKAFAEMRIQNAKLQAALDKLLPVTGLGTNLDVALAAVDAKAIETKAKDLGTSPEMLARLEQQERMIQDMARDQSATQITNAFFSAMTELGITQEQTYAFAKELQDAQIDVPRNLPQLTTLYRGMHFKELVDAQVQRAVQEALTRSEKAIEQSTAPPVIQGTGTPGTGSTLSLAELDRL